MCIIQTMVLQVHALSQFGNGSLTVGVDLIVVRQGKWSASKIAATAAKIYAFISASHAPAAASAPVILVASAFAAASISGGSAAEPAAAQVKAARRKQMHICKLQVVHKCTDK